MQKQRSPYTGGGGGGGGNNITVQQLKASKYGSKTDGLNGMPFLLQLAQQSQRSNAGAAVGHERGLRSGTPRSHATDDSYNSNDNTNFKNNNASNIKYNNNLNNNIYEGEVASYNNGDYAAMDRSMEQLDPLCNYRSMEQQQQYNNNNLMQSDTDSETEFCQHKKDFSPRCTARKYWMPVVDLIKSRMPLQRQERMELELRRCRAHSIYGHVLLMLQLLSIVVVGVLLEGVAIGVRFTKVSYRLWSTKFMLRGLVRQFLWRMANAKVNDMLLFLGILLITPWLFLISLVGLVVATVFHSKACLNSLYHHLCHPKD